MKYISTLIIYIIASANIYAQSFVKENKIWSVAEYLETEPIPKTLYYKFEGDTIINSIAYKKVFHSYSLEGNYMLNSLMFREEKNIIYRISHINHSEKIYYDFNLKDGDLFYWFGNPENPFFVDSVKVRNVMGIDRKHWYLSLGVIWIEGIGSLCSPVEPFGIFLGGGGYDLLCVHDEGTQIYQSPLYPSCEATSSSPLLSVKNNLIELLPSPAGLLRLSLLNGSKGVLSLYSPEGKLLFKSQITEKETEICSPSEGLMLFRFVNEKGEVQTGKVFAMP